MGVLRINLGTVEAPVWVDIAGGVQLIGGGGNPGDIPPADPHTFNDEFTGTVLDDKWTVYNPIVTHLEVLGVYAEALRACRYATASDNLITFVAQDFNSNEDFDLRAKVTVQPTRPFGNQAVGVGICFEGESGKWSLFHTRIFGGVPCCNNINFNADFSLVDGYYGDWAGYELTIYLRMLRTGTNIDLFASTDNIGYTRIQRINNANDRIGVGSYFGDVVQKLGLSFMTGSEPLEATFLNVHWVRLYPIE